MPEVDACPSGAVAAVDECGRRSKYTRRELSSNRAVRTLPEFTRFRNSE